MHDLGKPRATICIVNYRTLDFTRLCLRSLRKYIDIPCKVVVVDNGSADESLDYLRSLKWITLLERDGKNDPDGGFAHGAALDLALSKCDTEFFISMHSDTFVLRDGWIDQLIARFDRDPRMACVGSGKLELCSRFSMWLKQLTDIRTMKRKLFNVPDPKGKHRYYNRTICCFYRTDILKKENLNFLMDREFGQTVGKKMYFELVDRGYKTVEIPPSTMANYIVHLAHATDPVKIKDNNKREKTILKCRARIEKVMQLPVIKSVREAASLDV